MQITVILADDHELVTNGFGQLIAEVEEIELVATADNGFVACQLVQEHQPTVLLLDINMPGPSTFSIVGKVQEISPSTQILILTGEDHPKSVVRTLVAAGVAGYILKDEAVHTLVQAIVAVALSGFWFSQKVKPILLAPAEGAPTFTPEELELLQWLVNDKSNAEIAQLLQISKRTVGRQFEQIYQKMGVKTRLAAAVQTVKNKLVEVA
jgi:DNA-binding NarL/FixJ family response regulator